MRKPPKPPHGKAPNIPGGVDAVPDVRAALIQFLKRIGLSPGLTAHVAISPTQIIATEYVADETTGEPVFIEETDEPATRVTVIDIDFDPQDDAQPVAPPADPGDPGGGGTVTPPGGGVKGG